MKSLRLFLWLPLVLPLLAAASRAEPLAPAVQQRVDACIAEARVWAADPVLVKAVAAVNAGPSAEHKAMTQERWKSLTLLDPFVRSFARNEAAGVLKSHKTVWLSEAFISAADGTKVAFLSKPSNWSHAGKAKHDDPMAGKTWQGGVETDESTGLQQLQVAVPVLDGDQPVGSLVIGLLVEKL